MTTEGLVLITAIIIIVAAGTIVQVRKRRRTNAHDDHIPTEKSLSEQNAWWILENLIDGKRSAFWGKDNKLYIVQPFSKNSGEWMAIARFWITKDVELVGEELEMDARRIISITDKGMLSERVNQMYTQEATKKYKNSMKRVNGGNHKGSGFAPEVEADFDDWSYNYRRPR